MTDQEKIAAIKAENTRLREANQSSLDKVSGMMAVLGRVKEEFRLVAQFMCPVNAVTANWRHGEHVSKRRMVTLCNRQIDVRKNIEQIDSILSTIPAPLAMQEESICIDCFNDYGQKCECGNAITGNTVDALVVVMPKEASQ